MYENRTWHTDRQQQLPPKGGRRNIQAAHKNDPPHPESPKYLGINYPGEMWPAKQQG